MKSTAATLAGTVRRIPTGLGELAVRTVGSGPQPVVLWPSIFADSHIYDDVLGRLAGEATFHLIDGPGHGQSPGVPREFTLSEAAAAWLAVMDGLGLETATVGGVSWGGLVAAEVALASPGRVSRLILMNTPMDLDAAHPRGADRFIAFGARWMARGRMFRNGVAGSFFGPQTLRRNPTYAGAFHGMLAACDPVTLSAAVRSVLLRGQPLRPRLAGIAAPTLLIAGEEDALYPLESQARAARELRDVRFEPVPGRHISTVEAPDAVAALIRGFLRDGPQA